MMTWPKSGCPVLGQIDVNSVPVIVTRFTSGAGKASAFRTSRASRGFSGRGSGSIHSLGENRCRGLAEGATHAFPRHLADALCSRLRFEIYRHDVAASRIAAWHARIRVRDRAFVARAVVVVDQPGDAGLAIHYGFSIGARTRLPHSVHEP